MAFPDRRPSFPFTDEPAITPLGPAITPLAVPLANGHVRRNSFDPQDDQEEDEGPKEGFMAGLREIAEKAGQNPRAQFGLPPSVREPPSPGRVRGERRDSAHPMINLGGQLTKLQHQGQRSKERKVEASNPPDTAPKGLAPPPADGKDARWSNRLTHKYFISRRGSSSRRGSRELLSTDEEEYAYIRHRAIPLHLLEKSSARGSLVPDSCFQYKDVPIVEEDDSDPFPMSADTEKRCYLSSKRLMFHFSNQFFELARMIGKKSLTSSAQMLPPKLLCRQEVEGTYKEEHWHFIPTIEVSCHRACDNPWL